jgi:hypothetical protein
MPVITRRVDKKLPGNTGWWSDKERYQAVASFLIIGNLRLTAAAVGIPEETLRRWKLQPWWKEAEDEIRKSSKIELTGKIANVINKTMAQLEDRVENGDFFYNPKTGKFERKLINASVASKIAGELINKTILLEKEVTQERQTDEGLEDRLKKLKEDMERFAKARTITGEVLNKDELLSTIDSDVPEEAPAESPAAHSNGPTSPDLGAEATSPSGAGV